MFNGKFTADILGALEYKRFSITKIKKIFHMSSMIEYCTGSVEIDIIDDIKDIYIIKALNKP